MGAPPSLFPKKPGRGGNFPLDKPPPTGYTTYAKQSRPVHPSSPPAEAKGSTVVSARRLAGALCCCADALASAFFAFQGQLDHVEGGASAISNVTHQLNEEIRDKEVRLIGTDGEQLGIMSSEAALAIADEKGLDLVKISPQATPPVCKLMDYGKYRFEQSKREKEARKNQHVVEIKEIRMSPGIDVGDFNVKLKNAQKFLTEGNRVKVSVRVRGREMAHTDIGRNLLEKFAEQCAEVANLEKGAKMEGRFMNIFLSPKNKK